jgi:hypothetical protein
MVEPSQPQDAPSAQLAPAQPVLHAPLPDPALAELVRVAEEDDLTLTLLLRFNRAAVMSDPRFPLYCKLRRHVRLFVEHAPDSAQCLVCAGKDPALWLLKGLPIEVARHCLAHAGIFHTRIAQSVCCNVDMYHPSRFYDWRAHADQVRELERQQRAP